MKGKLIQIKEASKILGVSKLTLRNWDKTGKLTAYRHPINNYRVYRSEDIDRIIEQIESGEKPKVIHRKEKDGHKAQTYTLKVLHLRD